MPRPGQQPQRERQAPRLRRAYHESRHGQLHLHNAIPGGGGFDELTSVVCLHDAGETGQVFVPLLAPLGMQRSVYAPDLPGSGFSDAVPGLGAADAAVQAVAEFIDSMRIRRVDLIARGAAAAVAMRLLEQSAGIVRRVVLIDPPAGVRASAQVSSVAGTQAQAPRLIELLAQG